MGRGTWGEEELEVYAEGKVTKVGDEERALHSAIRILVACAWTMLAWSARRRPQPSCHRLEVTFSACSQSTTCVTVECGTWYLSELLYRLAGRCRSTPVSCCWRAMLARLAHSLSSRRRGVVRSSLFATTNAASDSRTISPACYAPLFCRQPRQDRVCAGLSSESRRQ